MMTSVLKPAIKTAPKDHCSIFFFSGVSGAFFFLFLQSFVAKLSNGVLDCKV